jgi:hypothetical protein
MNHRGTFGWSGFLLAVLLFSLVAGASGFEITKKFGGPERDAGLSVRSTYDGFIIAGQHGTDAWLVKTDKSGNIKWDKIFGNGLAKSVALTKDSNYVVTGTKGSNLWLAKIDRANGALKWEKTFGGTGESVGNCVRPTSDGGYIIAGTTDSKGAGMDDIWLIKTDSQGNANWDKTFGGPSDDAGFEVDQTDDGYVLAGRIGLDLNGAGLDSGGIRLIKTDPAGNIRWRRTYLATYPDCCGSCTGERGSESPVKVGNEIYYYLALTRCYDGSTASNGWLLKIDDGQPLWEKNIGDPVIEDFISDIQPTKDGKGLIAVGTSGSDGSCAKVYVVRADLDGNILWMKEYPQAIDGYNLGNSIDSTQNGGYVITGSSYDLQNTDDQMLLIIVGPSGVSPGSSSLQNLTTQGWWKRRPIKFGPS